MTTAHRVEVVLAEDGKVVLDELPFRAGQTVEIIVLPATPATAVASLKGTVLRYDRPTEPVAEPEWGAAK